MLQGPIAEAVAAAGLEADCPCVPGGAPTAAAAGALAGAAGGGRASSQQGEQQQQQGGEPPAYTAEWADALPVGAFAEWAGRLNTYLQVVEGRLYSEGLHVLGQPPSPQQTAQYLSAYFGEAALPQDVAEVRASLAGDGGGSAWGERCQVESHALTRDPLITQQASQSPARSPTSHTPHYHPPLRPHRWWPLPPRGSPPLPCAFGWSASSPSPPPTQQQQQQQQERQVPPAAAATPAAAARAAAAVAPAAAAWALHLRLVPLWSRWRRRCASVRCWAPTARRSAAC